MDNDWTYGTVLQHPGIKDLRVMFLSRRIGKWNLEGFTDVMLTKGFTGVMLTIDRYTRGDDKMKVGNVDTFYGAPDIQFSWIVER